MARTKMIMVLAASTLACGCTQNLPTPVTTGPMDPNSVTVFTLAPLPGSFDVCTTDDPGMTHPMTLTVRDDKAVLLTDGGIHYDLTRVRPNVYTGGPYVLIEADLSVRPKRLNVSSREGGCKWAATAP